MEMQLRTNDQFYLSFMTGDQRILIGQYQVQEVKIWSAKVITVTFEECFLHSMGITPEEINAELPNIILEQDIKSGEIQKGGVEIK